MSRSDPASRPLVGISRCLLGDPVRYDGGHRHAAELVTELAGQFAFLPLCPEYEAGLGVPRPPVQLVQLADGIHAQGVEDPGLDVTAALRDCAQQNRARLAGLSGFVFKARSPSCGVGSTPLFDTAGEELAPTSGLFAARVQAWYPGLPLAEDEQLLDSAARADFIAKVWAYFRKQ